MTPADLRELIARAYDNAFHSVKYGTAGPTAGSYFCADAIVAAMKGAGLAVVPLSSGYTCPDCDIPVLHTDGDLLEPRDGD